MADPYGGRWGRSPLLTSWKNIFFSLFLLFITEKIVYFLSQQHWWGISFIVYMYWYHSKLELMAILLVLFPHSSAPVYPSVAHCGFFARPGSGIDPDATGLLERAPWRGTKVSPEPVVLRPAGCSSFDSAASSHQQGRKRDLHRTALAQCSSEGNFQAVLARSSVSSRVSSALSDPVFHSGQLYRRTLTSPFCRYRHVACA